MQNDFWNVVQLEYINLTKKLAAKKCSSEEDPKLIAEIHQLEFIISGFKGVVWDYK